MSNLINNANDFAELTAIPAINQLSLKLVLDYYDTFLEPYLYTYKTKEDETIIELKFAPSHAPHLIGMHYAPNAKYGRNSGRSKRFSGASGYLGVKNGSITKQTIKDIFPEKIEYYKDMTKKMRYFHCLHTVLETPQGIYYNKDKNTKTSKIDCDIILYKKMYGQFIHLGLEKSGDKYAPKTFLIDSKPVFIDGQIPIDIQKTEKIRYSKEAE